MLLDLKIRTLLFNNPIGRGYDDGILSALEILKILDKNENQTISDLYNELTITFSSPTMSPKCPERVNTSLLKK